MPLLLAGRTFAELVDTTVVQTGHRHDTIYTKIMNKKMHYDYGLWGKRKDSNSLHRFIFTQSKRRDMLLPHFMSRPNSILVQDRCYNARKTVCVIFRDAPEDKWAFCRCSKMEGDSFFFFFFDHFGLAYTDQWQLEWEIIPEWKD